jgi:hypothetical protein
MKMGYRMKTTSRRDYLQRIYSRYRRAAQSMKRHILDEFCANCGYDRKYAIRLLNGPPPGAKPVLQPRRRRVVSYSARVISILKAVWESGGLSLVGAPEGPTAPVDALDSASLSAHAEGGRTTAISARAIDYRLGPHKRVLRKRIYGRTKPGTLLKQQIPFKTDRWDVQVPGFTEIDLVSHSGASAAGDCCHSLNLTDIHSGWVETRAVLGKGQGGVRQALEDIRQVLPFPLRGIDSDNGSEFINAHLYRYCQSRAIQFTRGRPYKKDDNAHIEQKNWTHETGLSWFSTGEDSYLR